jgi:MtrB/PioB family decaheme-associated outer membrane protein
MKQKKSAPLRRRTVVLAVGAALAALAATPALADPMLTIKLFRDSEVMFRDADMSRWADNYLELGVIYNSADSLRFGQFSGLTDQGAYANAGFNWISRDQANDAQYWQVFGANLGLDSRKFKAEGGIQGQWNANFSFDGLEKSQTDSARFHHQGLGHSTLTFPYTRQATATATNFPNSQFREYDIQQGRDIYRIGLSTLINKEWDFKVNYREDQRDGSRMTGFVYSSGNTSIVPYPIDDKTQQVEAILAYTTREAQFQLGYSYSKFSNSLNAFNVQSPFTSTTAANNFPNQRLSLAPDNDYHQISATGAYNFSKTTRLSATYSYGIASQDQNFLPYSVNGAAATTALPRNSLDAEVVSTLFDVALTSKPIDKMNLKVAYQYRDFDNRTPVNTYTYASRDATTVGAANSTNVRTNSPMSSTENKFILEGDYEIADRTVLRAGLEHANKDYGNADRDEIRTDKLTIEVRRPISDEFTGSAAYVRTERHGSDYDKNVYFRNTYTGTGIQANNRLTNNPSMRSYIWADFDEDRVRTSGNWTVNETLSLQGVVDRYQQKLRGPDCNKFNTANEQLAILGPLADTCLGRKEAEGATVSLDLQYQPAENLTTFAFGNVSQTEYKQVGRTWATTNGGAANASGASDLRNWYGDITATDYTAGFGLKWQPMEKWDVGATYVFNYGKGKTDIDQAAQPAVGPSGAILASTAVPDTWSKLHSVQLFAKWDYSDQLSWRFNYLYENLRSYDWATSNLGTTVPGVTGLILTGQDAPRYSNHVFGVSAVIRKW